MTKSDIHNKLADIQHQMRAPKNKNNSFGGYSYRNAEGIIAAFKSLNVENACLVCRDTLQEVAGQIFVSATAELTYDGGTVSATGHAMHPLQKKGMDASQITGSASSYARKYALCGLFAIEDESQDPDSRDNRQEQGQTPPPFDAQGTVNRLKAAISNSDTEGKLKALWDHKATKEAMAQMGGPLQEDVQSAYLDRMMAVSKKETENEN